MFRLFVLQAAFAAVYSGAVTDSKHSIINGEDANEGEFPFLLSLRLNRGGHHVCGGTVLTKNWLMTAARCCMDMVFETAHAVSGSIYLDRGGTSHGIDQVFIHEHYGEGYLYANDICVVNVTVPFRFDENVQKVILPREDFTVDSGDKLTTVGWGRTVEDLQPHSNRLQKANTFALTNEECGEVTGFPVFPGYVCARGGEVGQVVCSGDSGGPLLKNNVQVGITSWAKPSCDYSTPSFYARVSHYLDWIRQRLGDEASDLKFTD